MGAHECDSNSGFHDCEPSLLTTELFCNLNSRCYWVPGVMLMTHMADNKIAQRPPALGLTKNILGLSHEYKLLALFSNPTASEQLSTQS